MPQEFFSSAPPDERVVKLAEFQAIPDRLIESQTMFVWSMEEAIAAANRYNDVAVLVWNDVDLLPYR